MFDLPFQTDVCSRNVCVRNHIPGCLRPQVAPIPAYTGEVPDRVPSTKEAVNWLSDTEQRSWRALIQTTTGLLALLDQELQAAHGLTLAEYEVLAIISEADDGGDDQDQQCHQDQAHVWTVIIGVSPNAFINFCAPKPEFDPTVMLPQQCCLPTVPIRW